jgi:hypothetical protein
MSEIECDMSKEVIAGESFENVTRVLLLWDDIKK